MDVPDGGYQIGETRLAGSLGLHEAWIRQHLVIYYVCGRNSSCLGIFYTAIVFVANKVRVPSLRNVLSFSGVFLLSKAVVVLRLFLRLEDDDSAVALPTSPFWDSGTWQRQRSATVIIGVFAQGCGCFPEPISRRWEACRF